jgi:hypothetical protein
VTVPSSTTERPAEVRAFRGSGPALDQPDKRCTLAFSRVPWFQYVSNFAGEEMAAGSSSSGRTSMGGRPGTPGIARPITVRGASAGLTVYCRAARRAVTRAAARFRRGSA